MEKRLFRTLILMTAGILIAVGVTFNLFVQATIRSRVETQLASVLDDVSTERRSRRHSEPGKKSPGKPDRLTGTTGSALLLDEDGTLVSSFYGREESATEIAEYFGENGIGDTEKNRILTLESGQYAVSFAEDPLERNLWIVSYADVTSILAFAARINLALFVIILISIALSLFLSRRLAKSFAHPVQELSSFAEDIGNGNLQEKEFHFREAEFASLGDAMNRMVKELGEEKKKQELFYQNVSHELRTPLTSIRGSAEGILYGIMDPQSAASVILEESSRLGDMVEDILCLSRMGKRKEEDSAEEIDLREVLSFCASRYRQEAEKKGITFRFVFDEAPVPAWIRENDAERLFGNLIANAIRYAKSEVVLVCRLESGCGFVSVRDDGEGIMEEDLPHIFERFYKGKDGKHGIGLSIAEAAAQSAHAAITAHNDGGGVFEVRFPKTKPE